MSNLAQDVIRMPPVSWRMLEELGNEVLQALCPNALEIPTAIDLVHWVDKVLPQCGIHVTPVDEHELPESHAEARPDGTGDIDILVRNELWNQLYAGGPMANLARATIAHEIAHAILHVPVIRRRRDTPGSMHLLQRVRSDSIKPYEDPEKQAWMLAGCILAPRRAIEMLPGYGIADLAKVFQVSPSMMTAHLGRLKIVRAP